MVAMSIHLLATIFGVLGNIVSFGVFISPMPTFWSIFKKKSTQGFQSLPYSVALFSSMLYLYYAMIKEKNGTLIITINTIGVVIESFYLTVYMIYANKKAKVYTTKLIFLFNVVFFTCIVAGTLFFAPGSTHNRFSQGGPRESVVGWICAVFSLCVFAAPLSVMRLVIKTKSVEFMPFCLSFSLTLCAVMWFFYGILIHDFYIAMPNVLGLLFGITQMILYAIYKDSKRKPTIGINEDDIKQLQELAADIKLGKIEMINEEHIINFEQNRPEVIEINLDDNNNNENVAVNGQVVAEKENEKKGENQALDDGETNNNNNDVKGNGEKLAVGELPRGESSV